MGLDEIFVKFRSNAKEFENELKTPVKSLQKLNKSSNAFFNDMLTNSKVLKGKTLWSELGIREMGFARNKMKELISTSKKLTMQWLSVMFFGKAIEQTFSGLLNPALELVGIFELWNSVLQMLFLPIALALFDFLLPFFMWLMNLDDATKLMIGKIVLLAAGFGLLLFAIGAIGLGLTGLIGLFSGITNLIDRFIPDIDILGVNVSSFVEAGMGIGVIGGLMQGFGGIIDGVLSSLFQLSFVKDLLSSLGVEIDENKSSWDILKEAVSNGVNIMLSKLGLGGLTGEKGLGAIPDMLREIKDNATETWTNFQTQLGNIKIEDFISNIGKLTSSLVNMAPSLETIANLVAKINSAMDAGGRVWNYLFNPKLAMASGNRQTGGYVPHDGLYKLHAGETVSQANTNNFMPNIVVNASSNVDIDMLKRQLGSSWGEDLSRLNRR